MSHVSTDAGGRRSAVPRPFRRLSVALLLGLGFVFTSAATANAAAVYDNIPSPLPGNLVSQAFQATQASEFGGQIKLAGSERQDPARSR